MMKTGFILLASLLVLVGCGTNEVVQEEETEVMEQVELPEEEVEEAPIVESEETIPEEAVIEEEQPVEESDVAEEAVEVQEEELSSITSEEVNAIVNSYIGIEDTPADVSFENGEINTTIHLESDGSIPLIDLAVNRYSQLSDELLYYEGWEVLTVTFPGVGTVSMNRMEKETNDYGDYFPMVTIEERLY
ncbi:hypothetical protein FZC84_22160 [Rossellomorea vietnamensis]|uniref:Uncharacterized protein n=1 Tax=Rossellomorea vietnamensis TaxID=218284 RepID=A0A5D4LZ93_9BACI|nr:hypothetical protein [Rossellomorea vietnamensis]TYR94849.1 hypothetical protein FZC84_22160 [Rossellomorea vietnamensis]